MIADHMAYLYIILYVYNIIYIDIESYITYCILHIAPVPSPSSLAGQIEAQAESTLRPNPYRPVLRKVCLHGGPGKAGESPPPQYLVASGGAGISGLLIGVLLGIFIASRFSGLHPDLCASFGARQQASTGTASAAWKIEGLIRREGSAGTTVLVNSATTVLDNTPAWGMALTADTTSGGLKIEVTGAASTNIRWVATVNTSEVTY